VEWGKWQRANDSWHLSLVSVAAVEAAHPKTPPMRLQAQYMHLALALQASALPWLRQRGACDDAGRPPLAAVEAGVGEEELTGALAPAAAKRLRLAVSQRVLRVLLQLLR
jgi:hypothetical protein